MTLRRSECVALLIWPDMSILMIAEGKRDLGWEPLLVPLPGELVLVLGQQKAAFQGEAVDKKILNPPDSESIPEAMSAFCVWLELEPRAHVSAGRQTAVSLRAVPSAFSLIWWCF